jgi:hypothetical protein
MKKKRIQQSFSDNIAYIMRFTIYSVFVLTPKKLFNIDLTFIQFIDLIVM